MLYSIEFDSDGRGVVTVDGRWWSVIADSSITIPPMGEKRRPTQFAGPSREVLCVLARRSGHMLALPAPLLAMAEMRRKRLAINSEKQSLDAALHAAYSDASRIVECPARPSGLAKTVSVWSGGQGWDGLHGDTADDGGGYHTAVRLTAPSSYRDEQQKWSDAIEGLSRPQRDAFSGLQIKARQLYEQAQSRYGAMYFKWEEKQSWDIRDSGGALEFPEDARFIKPTPAWAWAMKNKVAPYWFEGAEVHCRH